MRSGKEIADIITFNLKSNNDIKFWNIHDLFDDIKLLSHEKKLINNVIDILLFAKVISFDKKSMCWINNYYGG